MRIAAGKMVTFLLFAVWVTAAFAASFDLPGAATRSVPSKVKVELYMESLCPYCAHYIRHTLSKAFEHELSPLMDLQIVPWVCLQPVFLTGRMPWQCMLGW
jgi:hypothetical protein